MKRLKLNKYQVALVFRNQGYYKTITEGSHWLWMSDDVVVYDLSMPFYTSYSLDIILKDEAFAALVNVYVVGDNEIGLLFENGLFKTVLETGRYVYWIGATNHEVKVYNTQQLEVNDEVANYALMHPELASKMIIHKVENHETALLMVNGVFEKELTAGVFLYWKNSKTISVIKADMRLVQLEINGQEILTADKANLRLNIVAQYKVKDAKIALLQTKDFEKQLYVRLQFAYREYISTMKFDGLLDNKDAVAEYVKTKVLPGFDELGAVLVYTGIRDIVLPGEVKEIMNQVLVAEKKAQANLVMRREETAATRSLLNTAKLMEENEMLMKLKEMEYVEKIADKVSNISLSGNSGMLEQLRQIFSASK